MTDQPATTDTISRHEFPFAQIPHALIEDTGLSHPAVRVYAYLMRRADNATGNAFPGQRFIAKEIGMSPSTVTKAVTDLEQRGWLEVTRRRTAKKESLANHYLVRTTRGGVPNTGTPVPAIVTGGVPPSGTELDEDLTRPIELELAAVAAKINYAWEFLTSIDGPFGLSDRTASQRKRVGRLAADINATLDHHDIVGEARGPALIDAVMAWPVHYPDMNLTPNALEVHLAALLGPPLRRSKRDMEDMLAQEESARWIAETEAEERALT